MKFLAKITISTIAAYRNAQGSPRDKYDQADTIASNLYMYGDAGLGIAPFDVPAYEQALEKLEQYYKADCERLR